MRIFKEVLSDYTDLETHETAIDGYLTSDPNGDGIIVAWVSSDGSFRLGEHSRPEYLLCELVQEHLRSVVLEKIAEGLREKFILPVPLTEQQYNDELRLVFRRTGHQLHVLRHLVELGRVNNWDAGVLNNATINLHDLNVFEKHFQEASHVMELGHS